MKINPVGGNGPPLSTSGTVKVKVRVRGDRTDTSLPEVGIFTIGMEFEVLEGASVPMLIGSNSMVTLGIEPELIAQTAYIGNDSMRMKIIIPHPPWEEVRSFIQSPIRVSPLQQSDKVDWSINLREGMQTRHHRSKENGKVHQLIQNQQSKGQKANSHRKAPETTNYGDAKASATPPDGMRMWE